MPSAQNEQLMRLLTDAKQGSGRAANQLFQLVYEQLRGLARQLIACERDGHTLQATALVHEAYLRLIGLDQETIRGDRRQFFHTAAEAMRRILIDHARARDGPRRGGKRRRIPLEAVDLVDGAPVEQILALDEIISRLETVSPTIAAVVRLRFYSGLSIDETAHVLQISPRTVKREWTYARAILSRELRED